jgi:hypothetical protein
LKPGEQPTPQWRARHATHETADAYALFLLNPNPTTPHDVSKIELVAGRFDLGGRSFGFQYHALAESYAT